MRLFAAVEIDAAAAACASALVEELRLRVVDLAPRGRITWVPSDRMHLTVRFIGAVDDERVDAVRRALAEPLSERCFDLHLAGAGVFPKRGAPRVLWAGLGDGREPLLRVEREVTARLAAVGIPGADRPFSPHLTLARIRDAAGLKARTLLRDLSDLPIAASRVEAITLFESRLSPGGATYVALQRTPLRLA